MKTKLIILFLFSFLAQISHSQTFITDKKLWVYKNGYTYDFEWTREQDDDHFFNDTLYVILSFPTKNDWKIYYDLNKTQIATLYHYDTIKKTINTKHFNRQGKLTKELETNYINRKNYNPGFIRVKNLIYLKSYINDSMVSEIEGCKTSILIKYNNYQTKNNFEKRVYYIEGDMRDIETGETYIEYYETGNIKSICSMYVEDQTDKEGITISSGIVNCKQFDKNGCIIKDK